MDILELRAEICCPVQLQSKNYSEFVQELVRPSILAASLLTLILVTHLLKISKTISTCPCGAKSQLPK